LFFNWVCLPILKKIVNHFDSWKSSQFTWVEFYLTLTSKHFSGVRPYRRRFRRSPSPSCQRTRLSDDPVSERRRVRHTRLRQELPGRLEIRRPDSIRRIFYTNRWSCQMPVSFTRNILSTELFKVLSFSQEF